MAIPLREVAIHSSIVPDPGTPIGQIPGPPDTDGPRPLSDVEIQGALRTMLTDAITYSDSELSPDRAAATRDYKGEAYGNEQEGRSSIVMTTVRDTILALEPTFLRMFFGTERAVQFVPKRADLAASADQQSTYITHLYRSAPDALKNVQAFIRDGLLHRLGFVKWYWETRPETSTQEYTGLTDEALQLLEADPGVTYTVRRSYIEQAPSPMPFMASLGGPQQAPPPITLHDCSVTRTVERGTAHWAALPPEEVLWIRGSRSLSTSGLVCHRREYRIGDLVAMGFAWDDIIAQARNNEELAENPLNIERNDTITTLQADSVTADPTMWKAVLYQCYALVDEDGDGIAERREFFVCGPGHQLLKHPDAQGDEWGVPVAEVPIAAWCPDPEPHTVQGQCPADWTRDLQRLDTDLIRGTLDSLSLALFPRTIVQEGQVNLRDVKSTEMGAVIRTTGRPGDVMQEYRHTFVGDVVLQVADYSRQIREQRVGQTMSAQGLAPDALQSSTETGVMATLTAAQERKELMARYCAEMLLVPLFRGLWRLCKQHQDFARTVRMQGAFVEIDPRTWDDDCEVEVTLALGGGLTERKVQVLQAVTQKQEQWMTTLGAANPLVDLHQYTQAAHDLMRLSGIPDPSQYMTVITPEQAQQIRQAAMQQPGQKDPQMVAQETQQQALAAEVALKQQQQQLDQQKFAFDQQYKLAELRQQFELAMQEIEAKYKYQSTQAEADRLLAEQQSILADHRQALSDHLDALTTAHQTLTEAQTEREGQDKAAVTKAHVAQVAASAVPPAPTGGAPIGVADPLSQATRMPSDG